MPNERITENIVRDILRDLEYYEDKNTHIEEQKSQIEEVKKLLKGASKTGKGGTGSPEFIISTSETPDFLLVFECKADTGGEKGSGEKGSNRLWREGVKSAFDFWNGLC